MDKLWSIIETESIDIEYDRLMTPTRPLRGFYLSHPEGPLIGLDITLARQPREEKCVLAEEIGHHLTAPQCNAIVVYRNYAATPAGGTVLLAKDERSAYRWATMQLMPTLEVCRALHAGCQTAAELADYFEVTEWFVYRKLGFLKAELKKKGLRPRAHELLRLEIIPELLSLASAY